MSPLTYVPYILLSIAAAAVVYGAVRPRPKGPFDKPRDFSMFWMNLDKFIVVGLFLIAMAIAVSMYKRGADAGSLAWIQNITSQLLSSIATLLGVKALTNRKDPPSADGSSSQPVDAPKN